MELEDVEKLGNSKDTEAGVEKATVILLAAIDDWPMQVRSLEEFCRQIEQFIESEATRESLVSNLSHINCGTHAWHAETLTQLLELFDLYPPASSLRQLFSFLNSDSDS